jgi:hypothetical protein
MMSLNVVKNIEVENVDMNDYPDFCDAYAVYAEYPDGTPLTEDELDSLMDNYPELIQEAAYNSVF